MVAVSDETNAGDGDVDDAVDELTNEVDNLAETAAQSSEFDAQAVSEMVERVAVAQAMGQSYGSIDQRDYFETLGYPQRYELDIDTYWAQFERGGIAERIVTSVSGATWADVPEVQDHDGDDEDETTSFEDDVATLFDETGALHYLERADTLQRIGRFGVLLIGFDDGGDLDEEVDTSALSGDPADDILYYQPFSEKQIDDFERVEDHTDERFGKPEHYDLDFGEDSIGVEEVHHSRVIHIAEGALEDESIGYSAYRPVFNYLIDLMKVVGGSAEMYWRSADRKIVANQNGEGRVTDEDKIVSQVEELVHGLRNVAWTQNVDLESLDGNSPDPSGLKDAIVELIAGTLGIPKRRLLGTERGDLASTQDEAAFVALIDERQQKFAEPQIYRRFLDKLVEFGVVESPEGGTYDVEWPDNFQLTDLEDAERIQRLASAVKAAAPQGDTSQLATVDELRAELFDWKPGRGEEVDGSPVPVDDGGDGDLDDTDVGVDDVLGDVDENDPEVDDWFEDHFGERAAAIETDGGTNRGDDS